MEILLSIFYFSQYYQSNCLNERLVFHESLFKNFIKQNISVDGVCRNMSLLLRPSIGPSISNKHLKNVIIAAICDYFLFFLIT